MRSADDREIIFIDKCRMPWGDQCTVVERNGFETGRGRWQEPRREEARLSVTRRGKVERHG